MDIVFWIVILLMILEVVPPFLLIYIGVRKDRVIPFFIGTVMCAGLAEIMVDNSFLRVLIFPGIIMAGTWVYPRIVRPRFLAFSEQLKNNVVNHQAQFLPDCSELYTDTLVNDRNDKKKKLRFPHGCVNEKNVYSTLVDFSFRFLGDASFRDNEGLNPQGQQVYHVVKSALEHSYQRQFITQEQYDSMISKAEHLRTTND